MTVRIPQCWVCKNFREARGDVPVCTAFPDGIPDEIFLNRHDHEDPYDGDHGIQFDLIDTLRWQEERGKASMGTDGGGGD